MKAGYHQGVQGTLRPLGFRPPSKVCFVLLGEVVIRIKVSVWGPGVGNELENLPMQDNYCTGWGNQGDAADEL